MSAELRDAYRCLQQGELVVTAALDWGVRGTWQRCMSRAHTESVDRCCRLLCRLPRGAAHHHCVWS